jgi:NADH-quinone oxidoreductase subunit L
VAEVFTDRWMDRGVIDGILHGIARFALRIGQALRDVIDTPVINGAGNALAGSARGFGFSLKTIQTGFVQQYLISGILVTVLVTALFIFLLS